MSAISPKIFGHDMAMDVQGDFWDLYGIGKTVDEINEYILSYQPDDDDEEACAFWSALALIEWQYGILPDYVKEKAQYIIKNHSDAYLYFRKKDAEARTVELQKLYELLNTINPKPKKRKKTFVYRTEWKEGDVYAIPLDNKYVYIHISAIHRQRRAIEELERDQVFVKVFDCMTDELLDIEYLESKISAGEIKYKTLMKYFDRDLTVKWLWCIGIREKTNLEKKVIHIGNFPTEREMQFMVCGDFQFSKVENTLCKLFELS